MSIIHPVEDQTCTATWLKAATLLLTQDDSTLYNLVLGIRSPGVVTPEEFQMQEILNEFLLARDQYPLSSIAGTIFPAGHYLQGGADAVFHDFPALYPRMKEGWGTYAYRMLNRTITTHDRQSSVLEILVEKLKKQKQKGRMRAAYEIDLVNDDDHSDISLYQPNLDCDRLLGQPCLTHLSFKLHPDDKVSLTALYRSHFYVQKALGNLLGLSQLMSFVAEQVGLEVGSLVCHSTLAQLEYGGSTGWKSQDVHALLRQCEKILSPDQAVA